jgi:hypothetical protein
MSTTQWIVGIALPALLMFVGLWISGLLTRSSSAHRYRNAIDAVISRIRFVVAGLILVVAFGLLHATFWGGETSSEQVPTPSPEACPDGELMTNSAPLRTSDGKTIAILEIVHSIECKASWARLRPTLSAEGVSLEATIEVSSAGTRSKVTRTITIELLNTETLSDRGGACIRATAWISSRIGSASATTTCIKPGG